MSAASTSSIPSLTIGLDLGDKLSRVCCLDRGADRGAEAVLPTTHPGLTGYFGGRARCRVVLEVGTHSPWVSRELAALGP